MSLQPTTEFTIPADTVQAVHSALPKGNVYLRMRDELGGGVSRQRLCRLV